MNKVILVGRLTKEIELKYTPSGVAVANFTLAVNRRFKAENGEREADFIQCQVWRKPAENAANFLRKGSKVGVVGEWRTRSYEGQDGKKVYVNECVVEELEFLDSVGGANSNDDTQNNSNTPQRNQNANTGQIDPFSNGGTIDIEEDDLPF